MLHPDRRFVPPGRYQAGLQSLQREPAREAWVDRQALEIQRSLPRVRPSLPAIEVFELPVIDGDRW